MAVKGKYSASDDELEYMRMVDSLPDKQAEVPWYKSYPAAAARGAIKGVLGVGKLMSGGGTASEEERAQTQANLDDFLEEYFPKGEEFGPAALERGVESGTQAAAFPGSPIPTAVRGLVGGGAAEGVKQMGGPEALQTGVEVAAQLTPYSGKRIPNVLPGQAAEEQRKLAQFARKAGMSEEELGLTLGKKGAVREFATDIAAKGARTSGAFDKTRVALGRVWNNLRDTPEAQQQLNGVQSSKLITGMSNKLSKMSSELRNKVQTDFNDLLGSQMRGEDVLDFWQKLNYYIGKGERGLGVLKEDLQGAFDSISPKLGNDVKTTNNLWGNYSKLAEKMGPSIADHLISTGEKGAMLSAVTTGNYPLMKKIIGPVGARLLAREMVINPRFQNLSSRFIVAANRGAPQVAKKVYDQMLLEVAKTNAEAAMALSGFDVDQFFESLPPENGQ